MSQDITRWNRELTDRCDALGRQIQQEEARWIDLTQALEELSGQS